jgi:secreted trypsin-like serine protease
VRRTTTVRRFLLALAATALVAAGAAPATAVAPAPPPSTDVVGGQTSPRAAWPMQAALLLPDVPNGFDAQFCGGTLVAPRWVLTAAHCVEAADGGVIAPDEVQVAVGAWKLADITTRDRVTVTEVVSHPRYRWRQTWAAGRHDVALLRLARGLPGPYAQLAGPAQDGAWGTGTVATVVGWGTKEYGTPKYARVLRQTEVPVVDDATCAGIYPELHAPSTLCAGWLETGGRDACQGDSGGPLWVPVRGTWRQVGVVSGGIGCAEPGHPGTYGDVRGLHAWIVNRIG